jgi:RNA polymerase sigma-70 factor (ECF subfamily)
VAPLHRDEIARAYRAYANSVLRRARQLLGNDAEAHDVVQEIFMSLLDRPEQFAGRSSLGTFLYTATTHLCLNRLRNRRNRERLVEAHLAPLAGEKFVSSPEALATLRQILALLPDEEARAAVHYFVDGMDHAEIGALLGCSRRRVGDLLERMRGRMSEREVADAQS